MFAAKSKFGGRAKRVSTNLQENATPESFAGRKYVFIILACLAIARRTCRRETKKGTLKITAAANVGGAALELGEYEVDQAYWSFCCTVRVRPSPEMSCKRSFGRSTRSWTSSRA